MAREFFCAYNSFWGAMEPLGDAERGRLFTALLTYSSTGEVPRLSGKERYIFPSMKQQVDRDAQKYEDKCNKNRQNVLHRYTTVDDRMQRPTKSTKTKTKEKEKTKEKSTPPLPPTLGGCGPALNAAFADWLAYKAERRQGYKATGLKALVARVEAAAREYGEQAVAGEIREAMANGWQGIAWDRLKATKPAGRVIDYENCDKSWSL